MERELEAAVHSDMPLGEVVAILRRLKGQGLTQAEAYALLDHMRETAPDEPTDDRILEVADFVAGFCAPHMRIWDSNLVIRSTH
jgi:hypothetical protein